MKCPRCHGERYGIVYKGRWHPSARVVGYRETYTPHVPCPDCYGTGEVSCCGDLGLFDPAHADDWPVNETPEQEATDEAEPPR